jgi:hypothetical protein
MALHRIIRIIFKQTNTVNMRMGSLVSVKSAVEIGRVSWAVVTLGQLKGIGSETVICIKISSTRLNRVISY